MSQLWLAIPGTAAATPPLHHDEHTFDGRTFNRAYDGPRLTSQYDRVFALMSDGGWRTLEEIAAATDSSPTGVSARLRDFRKPRCGAHTVDLRRCGNPANGVFEYRLIVSGKERP